MSCLNNEDNMVDGFNGDFVGDKTAGNGIPTHDLLT